MCNAGASGIAAPAKASAALSKRRGRPPAPEGTGTWGTPRLHPAYTNAGPLRLAVHEVQHRQRRRPKRVAKRREVQRRRRRPDPS